MLFLRPPDFTKLPKDSGAFPVRFGGAPDATDAFLLSFQNHVKKHAVVWGKRLWSYLQEDRDFDALPIAPEEKRRVDDAGSAPRTPPRKASFS